MLAWDRHELPREVWELARRVSRWQRRRVGRARMPEDLWEAALDLACEWGPYRTAHALGLSYSTLKRRLESREPESEAEEAAGPAFVEVLSPLVAGRTMGCVLELEGSGGIRIRVEVKDLATQDLVALLRGLAA